MSDKGILIEEYRGWEIYFYPDKERFTAFSDNYDWQSKEKVSLSSARKEVDDYITLNVKFVPVMIQKVPSMFHGSNIKKLVGIRKDGRFNYENEDGKLRQLSSYEEDDYFMVDEENDKLFKSISDIEIEIKKLVDKQNELKTHIKKVGLDTLKEKYKELYSY